MNTLSIHRRVLRGFTLTEILVAIALIVIVVSISVTALTGVIGDSQEKLTKSFVNDDMSTSLDAYKLTTGSYPTTDQGLRALVQQPDNTKNWRGPYIRKNAEMTDPWGNPYHYAFPGTHNGPDGYDIWSSGHDGIDGTADDIGNW